MIKKRNSVAGILISIFIPLAVGLAVLAVEHVHPFGSLNFIYSDGYQHTPMIYYVWDVLHGQKSPVFDWDLAYGCNMMGIISHFGLYSPLNLVYAFIPRDKIFVSLSWMFLLRISLMSASMRFFLDRCFSSLAELWKVLICCAYALSSWVFHYGCFAQWLDTAIWFPLVVTFLTELMKNKRSKTAYCLALSAMLITNFQQSYQVLLFALVYSGLYLYIVEHDKCERRGKILLLGCYTLLVLGLSAVILLPAGLHIMNSYRIQGELWPKLMDIFYTNAYPNQYVSEKLLLVRGLWIFWIIIVAVLCACTVKQKAPPRDSSVLFALVLLVIIILPVGMESIHEIWQGGFYNCFPHRNGFTMSFCTLLCFACTLRYAAGVFRLSTKREHIYAAVLLAAVLLSSSFNGKSQLDSEVLCSDGWLAESEDLYEEMQEIESTPIEHFKLCDSIFPANCCFVGAIPSNLNFMGIPTAAQLYVNGAIGYGQIAARCSEIGGTAFSDALCGYKYAASHIPVSDELWTLLPEAGVVSIYENRYAFPTGFFTLTDEPVDYLQQAPFDNQNSLSLALLGCKLIDSRLYPQNSDEISLTVSKKSAVYLYIPDQGFTDDSDISVQVTSDSGREPFSSNYASIYSTGILGLGVFENENLQISFDGKAANDIQIGILDLDALRSAIPEERVTAYSVGKRSLSLDVHNDEQGEQTMFLPLNNSVKGWSCTVIGENREISMVAGEFMGIKVPEGDSTVELLFTPPGLNTGLALAGLSLLLLLLFLLRPQMAFWNNRVLQSTALVVFNTVFFAFMIFGYAANLALLVFYKLRGLL